MFRRSNSSPDVRAAAAATSAPGPSSSSPLGRNAPPSAYDERRRPVVKIRQNTYNVTIDDRRAGFRSPPLMSPTSPPPRSSPLRGSPVSPSRPLFSRQASSLSHGSRPGSPSISTEYRVGRFAFSSSDKLGSGSFGTVYGGRDVSTGKLVAVKLEPVTNQPERSLLIHEARVLYELRGGDGIPQYLSWNEVVLPIVSAPSTPRSPFPTTPTSPVNGRYNCLVMDRLGPNLATVFAQQHSRFTSETLTAVACQLLERIEFVHSRGYIHRDLKPDNLVVGHSSREMGKLFLVDYGFAQKFKEGGVHVARTTGGQLIGTQLFMSREASKGHRSSRRDDLESAGYILLSLYTPLPWAELSRRMDIEYVNAGYRITPQVEALLRQIESYKEAYVRSLAASGGIGDKRKFDVALQSYFREIQRLRFDEKPNYGRLLAIFQQCRSANGFRASTRLNV